MNASLAIARRPEESAVPVCVLRGATKSYRLGVHSVPALKRVDIDDEIQAGRQTVVRYLSRVLRDAPDEWFNPMFLTRTEPGA